MEILVIGNRIEVFHPTAPFYLQVARTSAGRLVAWVVPECAGTVIQVVVGVA